MKSVIITAAVAIAALLGTTVLSASSIALATYTGNNNNYSDNPTSDANKLVAQLRQVTAKYHSST